MTRYLIACVCAILLLAPQGMQAQDDVARQIDALVRQYHDLRLFNGGVLVAQGGEIVYEEGFGEADMAFDVPNTPETKFLIGSVTKNFTGALILQLVEEGEVDLEAPITTYLPDYPAEVGDRVTVHHLLTHTSGIPNYTDFANFEQTEMYPTSVEHLIDRFKHEPLLFEPDALYSYSNSGYVLLGQIIEKTTGLSLQQAISKHLARPLKLKNTGLLVAGQFFGVLGLLLAVPVSAVIGVLVRFSLRQYRRSPYFLGDGSLTTLPPADQENDGRDSAH